MIMGILKRKENFAALTLSSPNISPVAMVKPDRENPGNIAIPCDKPINADYFQLKLSGLFLFFCDKYSAKNNIKPVPTKNIDVI